MPPNQPATQHFSGGGHEHLRGDCFKFGQAEGGKPRKGSDRGGEPDGGSARRRANADRRRRRRAEQVREEKRGSKNGGKRSAVYFPVWKEKIGSARMRTRSRRRRWLVSMFLAVFLAAAGKMLFSVWRDASSRSRFPGACRAPSESIDNPCQGLGSANRCRRCQRGWHGPGCEKPSDIQKGTDLL
ncbi:hypothetical protein FQA47_011942 [Oryzias melastigma]|uniref:Uncharacterized protein n=1 Tax=Oryzias melastigma TaxID=30732 RepID=A0A834CFT9_ORYME|nr:hypothetical protein FQA47_011942 [Oryzias melastigma]